MTVNLFRSPIILLLFLFFCFSPGCEWDVDLNDQTDGGGDTTPLSDTDSVDISDSDTESSENDSESEKDIDPPSPAEPCAPESEGKFAWEIEVNQVTGTVLPDFGLLPPESTFAGDLANDGSYSIFSTEVKIPIKPGTCDAAGYTFTLEAGTLSGSIMGPSVDGGKTMAKGSHPVVIVLAGFMAGHSLYKKYETHLASHGFAVFGLNTRSEKLSCSHHMETMEIRQAIDWLFNVETSWSEKLDLTKIAVAGHSKGGKLAFFAAAIDSRVDLVIGWDPSNSGGPPCGLKMLDCNAYPVAPNCEANDPGLLHLMRAETLVLGMKVDGKLNPDEHHNAIHFYRGAPSPASLVYIDSGHLGLLNPLKKDVETLFKRVQLAFLLSRFKGMTGVEDYLPSESCGANNIQSDGVVLRVESK